MIDFTTDHPPVTTDERMKGLRGLSRIEKEHGYVDERVAEAELPEPSFTGQRYESLVPDTLDLTDRAVFAINAYTRMLDPALDYRFCGNANFIRKPPVLIIGGPYGCTSKQIESLVLMRIMSGSSYNIDIDNKLMQSVLHLAAPDGFFYTPWSKVAWMPDYMGGAPAGVDLVSQTRQPHTEFWEESRMALALCMWHQHDHNALWQELIQKKIDRLSELAAWQGDCCHFSRGRLYLLSDTGPIDGPFLTGFYALEQVRHTVHACTLYYKLSGYEPALKLAGGLVRTLFKHGDAYDDIGRWKHWHFHTNVGTLISLLEYATTVDDDKLIEFVKNGYEFAKVNGEPLLGYYPEHAPGFDDVEGYELNTAHYATCETCEVADMLVLGLKLTLAGVGDYWDDVDRCLRNQFVENQILKTDWTDRIPADLDDSPYRGKDQPLQLWEDETDVVERAVGSWAGWATANDGRFFSLMQCCAGNAGRSMYYAWDSIVTKLTDEVRVNLHLNRASPWLDVESHLPYQGKVVLKIKDAPKLAVRIPDWTEKKQVTCKVNGQGRDLLWAGNYIQLQSLKKGDEVTVEFPMRETTLFKYVGTAAYKLGIKGNTVIEINPQGAVYPLYQRDHYRQDKAPMKKVNRFVPDDRIIW